MERYRVEPVGSEPDILPGRLMRDDDRDTSGKRAVRCTELTGTVQGQMHSSAFAGWPLNQPVVIFVTRCEQESFALQARRLNIT